MNMSAIQQFFKHTLLIIISIISITKTNANDTLTLTYNQCEAKFINENLLLMAHQFEISKAEADLIQAKLWPNPLLSIEDVNLWNPEAKQRAVFAQELPSWGKGHVGNIKMRVYLLNNSL